MSFDYIAAKYKRDTDFPFRTQRQTLLAHLLHGTFYDVLPYRFSQELNGANEYIPVEERKPSVNVGMNLLRTVVNDTVGLLFGEGRFPILETADAGGRDILHQLIKETDLVSVMRDAAYRGSVGSVAIQMKVLNKRVFWEVCETTYLTPAFRADAPDVLERLVELYKVKGDVLADRGYAIIEDDLNELFWFRREWDWNREIWFVPWKVRDAADDRKPHVPVEDTARSITHNLGFCPWVWLKNLHGGDEVDGLATFHAGIETAIQMDYLTSLAGRGLRYTADPMLLIKEPVVETILGSNGLEERVMGDPAGGMVRSPANALHIEAANGSDAKFLEIRGDGAAATMEHVKWLRDQALEAMGGNRSKPDAINSHQGAKALEILNAPLIRLTDNLRSAYGEYGLLRLLNLFLKAVTSRGSIIHVGGKPVPASVGQITDLSLRWGAWFPSTSEEHKAMADALSVMIEAGAMSPDTATKVIAREFDIEDIAAERALIEAAQRKAAELEASKAAKPQPISNAA